MGVLENYKKRRDLEKIINDTNLSIFNDQSPTHFNLSTGFYSAIDITLSVSSSYMDYIWKVHDDHCDSDHFLMIRETTQPIHDNKRSSCLKTNKANGQQFKHYAL